MFSELICIAIIIVYIVDVSGVIDYIKRFISNFLTKGKIQSSNLSLKPFDCSLCMMFWIGLIYILLNHSFTLQSLMLVCMMSFSTPIILNILLYMRDLMNKLIDYAYKKTIR